MKAEEIQSVLLATDANGNLGYVPNADNYDHGDYKSTSTSLFWPAEYVTPKRRDDYKSKLKTIAFKREHK